MYSILTDTEVSGISPYLSIEKESAPSGCLSECTKQEDCNLVAHVQPNMCLLYFVLSDYDCITDYTQIESFVSTTLYIKTRRTEGYPCNRDNQCMTEFGLVCSKKQCNCSCGK